MAKIQLPYTLKAFNLYVDGRGFAGRVEEVTPPKMSVKGDDHLSGGMIAPLEMDMGLEKLEISGTMTEHNWFILKAFGIFNAKNTLFTLKGGLGDDSSPSAVIPVEMICRGSIKEIDQGTFKQNEKSQQKWTAALRYYRQLVNGEEVHEVDIMNMIRKIDGVDQVEALRNAIGL